MVWNVARTDAEIAGWRARRVGADEAPGPLDLWHFDEQEGLSTVDAATSGFTGLLRGGATWISSEVPKS